MFEMVIEAVLVSFCVGGVLGSVITMHLQAGHKKQSIRIEQRRPLK